MASISYGRCAAILPRSVLVIQSNSYNDSRLARVLVTLNHPVPSVRFVPVCCVKCECNESVGT